MQVLQKTVEGTVLHFLNNTLHRVVDVTFQGCRNVLTDVVDYFQREINKDQDKRKSRIAKEVQMMALAGLSRGYDDDNGVELQAALHASSEEELRRRAHMSGGMHEMGGVSSQWVVIHLINTPSVPN